MAIINGSGKYATRAEHQTTNEEKSKQVDYDSPFPQVYAGVEAVCAQIKEIVEKTGSQRLAISTLRVLQKIAEGLEVWRHSPEYAPHPKVFDRIDAEVEARGKSIRLPRRGERRRLEQYAPESDQVRCHLGGALPNGDTWSPAPSITENSDHAELLRGLDNLHTFVQWYTGKKVDRAKTAVREYGRVVAVLHGMGDTPSPATSITEDTDHAELLRGLDELHTLVRSLAAKKLQRAKTAVREYGRVIALLLGATSDLNTDGSPNVLVVSSDQIRRWDILKTPRAPAPGFQLPCKSVPMCDLHSILDTGQLQISLVTALVGEGIWDQVVESLRQKTAGDEAKFNQEMENLAFAKIQLVEGADQEGTRIFHYQPPSATPSSEEPPHQKSDPRNK